MAGTISFNIRFPDGIRGALANEAKKNNRSQNAEIVYRLYTDGGGSLPRGSVYAASGSRTADQMIIRIPAPLHENIKATAAAAGRSMNSEMVIRLVTSLHGSGGDNAPVALPLPSGADVYQLRALRRKVVAALDDLDEIIGRIS